MPIYMPGQEPEKIQKRLQTLFPKLDVAYPDKVIRSLQRDHKKWAETVTELYRLLGYPDSESFLNAYGYTVERGPAGRQSTVDPHAIITELQKRYPNGTEFEKVDELFDENPDLKANLKTLKNKSTEVFGTSLKAYLMDLGLIGGVNKKRRLSDLIAALKERYPDGSDLPKTVNQLKVENADLPIEYLVYTKAIGETTTLEYLRKKGLIQCAEEPEPIFFPEVGTIPSSASDEKKMETYIQVLKQRYQNTFVKPRNVSELTEANPDIPVRSLNRYLRSVKGEKSSESFYIKNGVLRPLHETDLKEYTYVEVAIGKDHEDIQSEKGWNYISYRQDAKLGDLIVVPFGRDYLLATVRKVIHCLGVDAPWSVSKTKRVERYATAKDLLFADPKTGVITPTLEYYNEIDESSRLTSVPAGFQKYDQRNIILGEPIENQVKDDIYYLYTQFRGYRQMIDQLATFLKKQSAHPDCDRRAMSYFTRVQLDDEIDTLRVDAGCYTPTLIRQFAALKATGMCEAWEMSKVIVWISDSGSPHVTQIKHADFFDRKQEPGTDGRWADAIDCTKDYHTQFISIQTGDRQYVNYKYPFSKEWDKNEYFLEANGNLYTKKVLNK